MIIDKIIQFIEKKNSQKCNIENIRITIKHLERNQISASNNPEWVDVPIYK